MTVRLSWTQALAWRLERQLVEPLGSLSAIEIVRQLGGVQAQVASPADLAVRLRQRTPMPDEVGTALRTGSLIKTWGMRGTLHLFAADQAGNYLALLAAGRSWESPALMAKFWVRAQTTATSSRPVAGRPSAGRQAGSRRSFLPAAAASSAHGRSTASDFSSNGSARVESHRLRGSSAKPTDWPD